jgi:hypothetical protein
MISVIAKGLNLFVFSMDKKLAAVLAAIKIEFIILSLVTVLTRPEYSFLVSIRSILIL